MSVSLLGLPSHAHQVDAIAVSFAVGQVVAEVSAVDRNGLAIGKHPHILPDHLVVAEGRPASNTREGTAAQA